MYPIFSLRDQRENAVPYGKGGADPRTHPGGGFSAIHCRQHLEYTKYSYALSSLSGEKTSRQSAHDDPALPSQRENLMWGTLEKPSPTPPPKTAALRRFNFIRSLKGWQNKVRWRYVGSYPGEKPSGIDHGAAGAEMMLKPIK